MITLVELEKIAMVNLKLDRTFKNFTTTFSKRGLLEDTGCNLSKIPAVYTNHKIKLYICIVAIQMPHYCKVQYPLL